MQVFIGLKMSIDVNYDLSILGSDVVWPVEEFFKEHPHARYALEQCSSWTTRISELEDFSKRYSDLVFVLKCDSGVDDAWIEYYQDGKIQREQAIITYPSFDASKLK